MSNSLFGNPKIALGFAGGVVAIALVASVALNEFTPGEQQAAPPAVAAAPAPAAPPPPASAGFAQGAGTGWGDTGSAGSGWGAAPQPSGPASGPSFTGPSASDPFADLGATDDGKARVAGGRNRDQSSDGPTITTRTAPGAPEVRSPNSRPRGELKTSGN